MRFETIACEVTDGVLTVTLDRPERMNAINAQMKADLAAVFDTAIPTDPAVRAVVITGSGERAFCAGADIKERAAEEPTPAEFITRQRATVALFDRIARCERPVIAALNGLALGGGLELALAADIRFAAAGAVLGLPEVDLGVIPAGGGTQRLARLVGPAAAKRLILTAARIDAETARGLGLVDEVHPAGELRARAHELARTIATKPPLAVRFAKQVIDCGLGTDLATGLELELQAAAILFDSQDRREGMAAFLEKRAPRFAGR